VQHFAEAILTAADHRVDYSGDPLVDFSTMAFLDRFSYKNPKQARPDGEGFANAMSRVSDSPGNGPADASSIATVGGLTVLTRRLVGRQRALGGRLPDGPVNAPEFMERDVGDLGKDRLFFHKFFKEKAERDKKMKRKTKVGAPVSCAARRVRYTDVRALQSRDELDDDDEEDFEDDDVDTDDGGDRYESVRLALHSPS
jgi:hypothetical protein